MNTIITIIAWFAIAFSVLFVLAYPFQIGKPKTGNYDGKGYLQGLLIELPIFVLLAGRALGWW